MTAESPAAAAVPEGGGALAASLEVDVRTDPARVAAFRAVASGCAGAGQDPAAGGPAVPLTYPFCWITLPEVRPVLERMIGSGGVVPVHEAQSFDYAAPLALDAAYRVAFAFERRSGPDRLIVKAAVSTPGGAVCARFETVLRLVVLAPSPPAGASVP